LAHVRTRCRFLDDDAMIRVTFSVGPDARHLREAGELDLRATEFNAIDRLLTRGASREDSYTYDGPPPRRPALLEVIGDDDRREVPAEDYPLSLARGHR
jgi:hypothetical protein